LIFFFSFLSLTPSTGGGGSSPPTCHLINSTQQFTANHSPPCQSPPNVVPDNIYPELFHGGVVILLFHHYRIILSCFVSLCYAPILSLSPCHLSHVRPGEVEEPIPAPAPQFSAPYSVSQVPYPISFLFYRFQLPFPLPTRLYPTPCYLSSPP